AVLLERAARKVAEPVGDVLDLARHRLVFAQLEEVRAAARCVGPVGLAMIDLRVRGGLHQLIVDAVDQRPVLLGLGPLLDPLGVGAPGGALLGALLEALPAPDVDELVAPIGDDGRPEADQAKAVLLPLVNRESPQAVGRRGELPGGDIVGTRFVELPAPPLRVDGAMRIRAAARLPPAGALRLSRPAGPAPRT